MGLSKTWYTSANRAMDDVSTAFKANCSIWFALKEFLRQGITGTAGTGGQPPASAAWTVDSSSDGVTASGADNLGGNTFTAAKWVRAAAGSAHSWWVMKSPASAGIQDGPYYVMLSLGTNNDNNIILGISKVQPTGGTTTADPTAAGQSLFATQAYGPGVASNGKCSIVMDAKGNFRFHQSINGGGRFVFFCSVDELVETRSSGDAARVVMMADSLNSGTGTPRVSTTLGTGARGLANDGTTALSSTTGKLSTLSWNGSGDASVRLSVNAIDSKADAIPAVYLYDSTVAHAALRGRVPDMWLMGAQVAPGSGTPAAATPDRIMAGEVLTPFSVTPSL